MKKIQQIKQIINVPLKDIINQYDKFFNNSNYPEDQINKLIETFKANRTESERKQVTEDTVRNVINKLNNGKSVLFLVVSNKMLKYESKNEIVTSLTYVMEWIINSANLLKTFQYIDFEAINQRL